MEGTSGSKSTEKKSSFGDYERRREGLDPEVRSYTDKLHSRLLGIYAKYGAHDLDTLLSKISQVKVHERTKKDAAEVADLIAALEKALDSNELPPDFSEFPTLKDFENMVEEVEQSLPNHKVVGLDDWDKYQSFDGKISGRIKIMDEFADVGECWIWVPVIRNHPILKTTCDGHDQYIRNCSDVIDIDGNLNGAVTLDNITIPVIDGQPIESVSYNGNVLKIVSCDDIRNIDGKLNGSIKFDINLRLPVIQGRVIENVIDENGVKVKILHADNTRNVNGGLYANININAKTKSDPDSATIVEDVAMYTVKDPQGRPRRIEWIYQAKLENGKLHGIASFLDDSMEFRILPVMDGTMQDEVHDDDGNPVKINSVSAKCYFKDGKLNGSVELENIREYPVVGGVVRVFIPDNRGDSAFIRDSADIRILEGKINGKILLENWDEASSEWLPVVNGKILNEIQGQKIYIKKEFDMSTAGGVFNGQVIVTDKDGKERTRTVLLGKFLDE